MRSMQQQLGMLGTVSAFAYRHRETKKNLCRGGRSQDLPSTDFQPAVRHLKYKKKKQYTHSTTNTHKITTTILRANQQQLHTRQLKTSNNTHETNQNFTTCTKGKNTQARKYCVQFLVIVFLFWTGHNGNDRTTPHITIRLIRSHVHGHSSQLQP